MREGVDVQKDTMSVRELAEETGIGQHTIRADIRSGHLDAMYSGEKGGRIRIKREGLSAWRAYRASFGAGERE